MGIVGPIAEPKGTPQASTNLRSLPKDVNSLISFSPYRIVIPQRAKTPIYWKGSQRITSSYRQFVREVLNAGSPFKTQGEFIPVMRCGWRAHTKPAGWGPV